MRLSRIIVVIVTYNGRRWIKGCLNSLINSSVDVDILVVDNASSDGTAKFIKQKFGIVTLIELPENIGFGKANNIGLSRALELNYEYVFLLNQDAQIYQDTIKKLIKTSQGNREYGIISPIHLDASENKIDHSFEYYLKHFSSGEMLSDLLLQRELNEIYDFRMVNAAAWLLPVNTLRTVGGFHPMFFLYGEDDNYCQRVLFHGLKIGVAPSTYIIHDSENNNLVKPVRGSEKYFEKFKTQLKVKYADVNTENYKQLNALKLHYYKQTLKNLTSFKLAEFRINLHKGNLIRKMDFTKDVEETRKVNSTYLASVPPVTKFAST